MGNINVAVIGEAGYARNLGKKGTSTDITFYNAKRGEDTITSVEPSRYPEKLSSLFYALSLADYTVFVVDEIDAAFGESVIAADVMGIDKGTFILRNYHTEDEIKPLLAGTALERYSFMEDDPTSLREELFALASSAVPELDSPTGSVAVDHFFNVKGVGTVILGTVREGTVRKHDDLRLYPDGKTAHVRSIQKHDDDFDAAGHGDRVGLALKNATVEDLDRGSVLSSDNLVCTTQATVKLTPNRFWKKELREGAVLHIGHWMQFLPARVTGIEGETITLKMDRPIVHPASAALFVSHLDAGKLRVVGKATIVG